MISKKFKLNNVVEWARVSTTRACLLFSDQISLWFPNRMRVAHNSLDRLPSWSTIQQCKKLLLTRAIFNSKRSWFFAFRIENATYRSRVMRDVWEHYMSRQVSLQLGNILTMWMTSRVALRLARKCADVSKMCELSSIQTPSNSHSGENVLRNLPSWKSLMMMKSSLARNLQEKFFAFSWIFMSENLRGSGPIIVSLSRS